MLKIVPADPQSVAVALGVTVDLPAVALVGMDGNEFVGSGGLAWGGGRCWVWFSMINSKPEYVRPVLKTMKLLKSKAIQLGEAEIFTIRDPAFETSARLVRLAGFDFYAVEQNQEVHRCKL